MTKHDDYKRYFNNYSNNVLLEFEGPLSQNLLIKIGDVIVKKVAAGKLIKTIFAIFIELAQNIMHYSSEKEKINEKDIGVGIILFCEDNDYYRVRAGNRIDNKKAKRLKDHLNKINSLNNDDLKIFYKDRLRASADNDSKGAGLGLIDIARKSKNEIEYDIIPIDKNESFLKISVNIRKV